MHQIKNLFIFFYLIAIFFLFTGTTFSQSTLVADSNYILSYKKKITLRFILANNDTYFSIKQKNKLNDTASTEIKYTPNLNSNFGFGITYKHLAFNILFRIPKSSADIAKYGDTKYQQYRLNVHTRKITGNIYYQQYQGFYLKANSKRFINLSNLHPYMVRKDVYLRSFGTECAYVFNHRKFSMNATYKQSERQIKNANSFLILTKFQHFEITADSSLIPVSQQQYYSEIKDFSKTKFDALAVLAGFTNSFTFRQKFFITPFLYCGKGVKRNVIETKNKAIYQYDFPTYLDCRLSAGFNGDNLIYGMLANYEYYAFPERNISYKTNNYSIQIFTGFRF